MKEKKEASHTQHQADHLPSSCELMLSMLASPPSPYIDFKIRDRIPSAYNTTDNLVRAYFACQNHLEVSPSLSTNKYSIFVTPDRAEEQAAEAKVLQQHGKF